MTEFPKLPLDRRILGTEMEYTIAKSFRNKGTDQQLHPKDDHYVFVRDLPLGLRGVREFLSNGARYYVDTDAGVEYATPEVASAADAVAAELAGERILVESARKHQGERTLHVYKNLASSKRGRTAGHHENYGAHGDIERQLYFDSLMPHLISRIIFNGAGGLCG